MKRSKSLTKPCKRTRGLQIKIRVAHQKLEQKYPVYVKKGKTVTLEAAEDGKVVVVVGPRGGRTPLFKSDGRTINPKIPKDVMKVFGPTRADLIQQKDEKIEELDKTMQEDTRVANYENEEPSVRERAREKITENTERKDQAVQEREKLVKKLPLRERIKEFFKKYGWTLTAVLLAVGATIGNIVSWLSNGIQSAANN